jgi:hypothetical protein
VVGLVKNARERLYIARASLRRCFRLSDYRRWGNPSSLIAPEWDSRTEQIAKLISPGSTVLEFGAARMTLRKYLPHGCKYTPSDLVDRGNGTIVCDLNAHELPSFPGHDVAVFSGVLEFLYDVRRVVEALSNTVSIIVASYSCLDHVPRPDLRARRAAGWVNDFTSEEFEAVFHRSGFRTDHIENWGKQKIYRFVHLRTDGIGFRANP